MTRMIVTSCTILGLGLLAAAVLFIGCGDSGVGPAPIVMPEPVPPVWNNLRYNEVCFKEVHNSYQRHVPFETALSWVPSEPWKYGAGCVEMDLRIDPGKYMQGEWDWSISHVKFEPDPKERFAVYLNRLQAWSKAHPGHRVLTVQIDAKDGPDEFLFEPDSASYINNLPSELDKYIAAHFDTALLFKPRDMIKNYADLVAAARAEGWPTLGELTGKVIIVFGISFCDSRTYSDVNPKERLCFSMARFRDDEWYDSGNRIFFQWDIRTVAALPDGTPWQERALWLRKEHPYFIMRGQNICQDANEDLDPDCGKHTLDFDELRDGVELWAMARAAKINMISSDLVDEEKWAIVGTMPLWPISKGVWGAEDPLYINGTRPAVAEFQSQLHVVFNEGSPLGSGEGPVCSFTGDGSAWGSYASLGFNSTGCPAVAVCRDTLWTAYPLNGALLIRSFDGAQWSSPLTVAPVSTGKNMGNAGMTVYKDEIYVIYPDILGRIAYRRYDGSAWSSSVLATGSTDDAPAVCVFEDKMYVFYHDDESNLYMTGFDGSAWSAAKCVTDVNGARTDDAPAAVVAGGQVNVVLRSPDGDRLYMFSIMQGGYTSGLEIILQGSTSEGVGITHYGSGMFMIYQNGDGDGGLYNTQAMENID